MYRLQNISQEQFNGLRLSEVVSEPMIESIRENNPLGLNDLEIVKLLNLSWKYEKPMTDLLKDLLHQEFDGWVKVQKQARNHKYKIRK